MSNSRNTEKIKIKYCIKSASTTKQIKNCRQLFANSQWSKSSCMTQGKGELWIEKYAFRRKKNCRMTHYQSFSFDFTYSTNGFIVDTRTLRRVQDSIVDRTPSLCVSKYCIKYNIYIILQVYTRTCVCLISPVPKGGCEFNRGGGGGANGVRSGP